MEAARALMISAVVAADSEAQVMLAGLEEPGMTRKLLQNIHQDVSAYLVNQLRVRKLKLKRPIYLQCDVHKNKWHEDLVDAWCCDVFTCFGLGRRGRKWKY